MFLLFRYILSSPWGLYMHINEDNVALKFHEHSENDTDNVSSSISVKNI